jgi:molybdopterin converting factor small subunit
MKKALLLAALLAIVWFFNRQPAEQPAEHAESVAKPRIAAPAPGPDAIAEAYANHASDVQVAGEGTVSRLLDDDEEGGRHQRFILRLASGKTVLVAHNIDLAPRIDALQDGDTVSFNGVYEWNDRGGVIHWTHHDPQGEHEAGWLRHRGRTYQ